MGILDQVIEIKEEKKQKYLSGEMLFPEDEEEVRKNLIIKKRKKMPETTPVSLVDMLDAFDPETATKKQIRALRKALSVLSNEKFPRKKRVKTA